MMKVYLIEDFNNWHRKKGYIGLEPLISKKGYFLPLGLEYLWSELDWKSLKVIELLEEDLIHEEILD